MKMRDIFHDTFTIEFHLLGIWFELGIWQKRHFRIPFTFHIISPFGNIIAFNWTIYSDFHSVSIKLFNLQWCSAQKQHDKISKDVDKWLREKENQKEQAKIVLKEKELDYIVPML